MTREDVEGWIAEGEGRRLEFKSGLPRPERTARVLCAFANTNGGILLVGVTDRGAVQGVPRPAEVVARLERIAAHGSSPPIAVQVRPVELDGGTVVCCSVPLSAARPHSVLHPGGAPEVVVRVGSSNRVARGATLRALGAPSTTRSLSALERRALEWVARHAVNGDRPDGGATVRAFARAHNVGVQRARRTFVQLERTGRLVAHGTGAGRVYAVP